MCLKSKHITLVVYVLFLLSGSTMPSYPAHVGSAEEGMRIFRQCIACHHASREDNKVGPSLKNVMHRQAGTKSGYRFSPAMIKAGENGLVWNKQTLKNYLHNPQTMVKGTRMPPVRITSEQDIDDLIAYLEKASQE